LDNAIKATPAGGSIRLHGRWHGNAYLISLHDTGRGIPAAELSRISEPFYMVDKSRARAAGGVGLGLSICREILELHGFRLDFASGEGRGTTATVTMEIHPNREVKHHD
ncbi:MAG: ATP-binding protein, partial [Firmicutes bacterium]|nr:ATP-binding protein [Bacillota bacterium]